MAASSGWVGKFSPGVRRGSETRSPVGATHQQQLRRVGGPARGGAERVGMRGMHQRHGGAAVLEEILDGVGLELRVDHHNDGADLQDAEQRRDVVGSVGQGDDHPLFRRHPRRTEHVGIAVGQCLHLAIAQPSGIGLQRGPVAPTLAHPGIEKEVGDVEVGHGREDTIIVQPLAAMTWEEARDATGPKSVAILPVGAIEAHGPHLPLETDVIIAQAMARAGAARLDARGQRAVVLPPLSYTAAAFRPWLRRNALPSPGDGLGDGAGHRPQPGPAWIRSAGHRQRASRSGPPRFAGGGRRRDPARGRAAGRISQSRPPNRGPSD